MTDDIEDLEGSFTEDDELAVADEGKVVVAPIAVGVNTDLCGIEQAVVEGDGASAGHPTHEAAPFFGVGSPL